MPTRRCAGTAQVVTYACSVTRHDRLTRDDYQAAMASLDWQDRRQIEFASYRGDHLDDPAHAALAGELGRQRSLPLIVALLVTAALAAFLLWSWVEAGSTVGLWLGGVCAVIAATLLARVIVYRRARARHLHTADFDAVRTVALQHRTTYRRRD